MIDSVLKGTGNSRFLKSAVPAGTSWADALAMLQAGTFPIDFNGINTEGFQQVGTPLNKANLLKDATAAQIGLPPSTTPDGMFQALGNTGELHVWKKTVVTGTAKVELEPAVSGYIVSNNGSNYNQTIKYSSTIDEKGNLSGSITTLTVSYNTSNSDLFVLKGKYFEAGTTEISSNLKSPGGVWYIPNDASIQYITGQPNTTGYPYYYTHVATKMQKVVYVPTGTTTTYPVSTNPNAYQEGDDAKEAGYTLGDVVTGKFRMGDLAPSNAYEYEYADGVTVDENGTVSLQNPSGFSINSESHQGYESTISPLISGKFLRYKGRNSSYGGSDAPDTQHPFDATPSVIVYIPADVVVTSTSTWPAGFFLDKYQPVTGYAAIPAGTTIEYLGKLGDKARVQVVSYVGMGTYGKDNKNQLTFSRKPRFIMVPGDAFGYAYIPKGRFYYVIAENYATLEDLYCVWDDDTNTMTWYHPSYPYRQYNQSGTKYTFVAIY